MSELQIPIRISRVDRRGTQQEVEILPGIGAQQGFWCLQDVGEAEPTRSWKSLEVQSVWGQMWWLHFLIEVLR